jgi:anti-sigma regulatory factor (Ser/Thr protein kinase)
VDLRWLRSLSTEYSSVAEARHWVEADSQLAGRSSGQLASLLVVVSELVTNAIMHGRAPISVALGVERDRAHVEVWDAGEASPAPADTVRDPFEGTGGWGLELVSRLSDDWGVCAAGRAKCVWAEVPFARTSRPV